MSFNSAEDITLTDKQGPIFTGGIIDNSTPFTIPYKNTPYARNFRVNGRGISIRPGFYKFGDSLGATGNPKGIAAYYRSNPANDRIITRFNTDATHKLVSIDPASGAQTSILTDALITSDNRMSFMSSNDSLYCMNGVDLIGKLNGTTYTNPVATLKPSFGAFFDNSLFVGGDPANPNKFYKSVANDPEDFTGTGSDEFTASYPVTSLTSAGRALYVFTKNTLDMINNESIKQISSTLVYTSIPLESNEGAVVHASVAVYGKECYYLSASNKLKKVTPGKYSGYDVEDLSHRPNRGIDNTMATLDPDQSDSFAYVIPELGLIKWHVKTRGAIYNDLCIVYSIIYDQFMVDDHKAFYAGVNYNTKNFTVSHVEPKVYRDEEGQTDDDSPIQFSYRTKKIDLGAPHLHKELWQERLWIGINELASVTQTTYMDGNNVNETIIDADDIPVDVDGIGTEEVGTFAIGEEATENPETSDVAIVVEKGDLQVRGKYFEIEWTCGSAGAKLLLQQFVPRVEMLNQLTSSTR